MDYFSEAKCQCLNAVSNFFSWRESHFTPKCFMILPVSSKEIPKAFDLSSLCRQAGHQWTCIFIHFTVNKGLKSKNWGNGHLWGIWGKSVELQFEVQRRGEGGSFFLFHIALPLYADAILHSDTQGDNCKRYYDCKLNCLCCCWTKFSIKTTLLPAVPRESNAY